MGSVNDLLRGVTLPDMALVRQHFPDWALPDPAAELAHGLERTDIRGLVRPGMTVAVTAGSRGLDAYVPLLRQLIASLKGMGAEPFVVPAMGSHGGAAAEGQKALLAGYGVTEETVGAPIRSSMEVVQVASTPAGEPVWLDKTAAQSDGIVLFNRVKPHTGFRGRYESGLLKMAAVGLGKQKGAETVHAGGPPAMAQRIETFGTLAIEHAPILFGVATVENAYDKVCAVRALTVREIFHREPQLLEQAKALLPRLFFEDLDVLVVDRIGKNISGPGMDPNITHTYLPGAPIPQALRDKRARRVAVLDLTEETHGAAMGIGMADVTTRRLLEKMDPESTYPNCLTSGVTASGKLPMAFDSHRLAIQAAVRTLSAVDGTGMRMVRIRDTLHLGEIWISAALLPQAREHPDVELLAPPAPMAFDDRGNLF